MLYSIVDYSEVDLGNRIDAEYFQPTYLEMEKKLESLNGIPLRDFCAITGSAFYPAATHLYSTGDLPFIRCVDCISYPIITTRQNKLFEKIPTYFANEQKNIKTLLKGEIVITKVGSPCYTSIIHDLDIVALSRTVLGLKSIHGIDPYYLVAFLRSKYGFLQLVRERELTIQYQLTLDRVGSVLIFKPENENLEKTISQSLFLYEEANKKAKLLFQEAQTLLITELGLANWQPKHRLSFVRNSSDVEEAERIDAEYYQPKYYKMLQRMRETAKEKGWQYNKLKSFSVPLKYGSSTKFEYISSGVPFLRIADIKEYRFSDDRLKYIDRNAIQGEPTVRKGDVIVSRSGTLGLAVSIPHELDKAIFGSYFIRVRPDNKQVNSVYLALFINTLTGQLQVERASTGSIQTNLTIPVIENFDIVLPDFDTQKQIAQIVIDSFKAQDVSKQLLEAAKRAVEITIEEDEERALAWLNEEINRVRLLMKGIT